MACYINKSSTDMKIVTTGDLSHPPLVLNNGDGALYDDK